MANAAMILTTHVLDKLREAFQSIVEGTVMAAETFSDSCHGRDSKHCSQLPDREGAASRPLQVREKASTDVA